MTHPKYAEAGSASLPPGYAIPDDAPLGEQEALSAHDHDTHENSHKRNAPTELKYKDEDEDEPTKRRRLSSGKKSNAPPKKLNNEQWDHMFQRLVEYKAKHGDCLVPKRYAEDPKLGTWVETQRVQWKKLPRSESEQGEVVTPNKRLNDERLRRLEAIGFAWSAKNIHKPKPASPATTPAPKARKSAIGTDSAARAEARQRSNDTSWNEMYNRLAHYKEKHGDCLVPKKFQEDPKLASWVELQRNLFNRDYKKPKPEPASNEESPKAASMPPVIEGKTPEEWAEEMAGAETALDLSDVVAMQVAASMDVAHEVAEAAMEVVNEVTATPMEDSKPAAEEELDAMGSTKRLTKERRDKLDALGFVWSLRIKRVDDHWDTMYQQLVEYKETHGDCLVPSRFEENNKLGKWVETQRYEYTKLQRATEHKGQLKEEEPVAGKNHPTNPRLTEERRRRLEAIGFEWKVKNKMKRYYDRQWDAMFEKLLKFKEEQGNCLVPKRYPPDIKLGTWVHTQRIQYRKYLAGTSSSKEGQFEDAEDEEESAKGEEEQHFRLTEDRRQRLDDIGFVWSARDTEKASEPARIPRNSYDNQWDAMFARLVSYKEKHGNCLVPKRCKEDPKLGTWVDTQRVQHKKMLKLTTQEGVAVGSKTSEKDEDGSVASGAAPPSPQKPVVGRLTDERIARLENLGFVWSLRDDWQKHYEELKEYKKKHGDCNVPARYAKNRRLGIWVSAQRQQKKIIDVSDKSEPRKSVPLTKERIDLLNELDFTWTIRSRDSFGESWHQRLEELKAYKKEHGNCLVPSRYPPNPELGIWVGTQRTQYRHYLKAKEAGDEASMKSAMNEDRVAELEEMGFIWALRGGSDSAWRKRISQLLEYRTLHGDTVVPSTYKANKLGSWAAEQREQYRLMQEGKPSSLDEEKVAELDSLHFSWEEPVHAVPVEAGIAVANAEPIELDVGDDHILIKTEI